ncbi:CHD3-type chromatin-remodeling factor PICKLE-like [Glycine soja]|uniref:CHD3-type chromatin-remodeling factor PICKLE-like n=1 Tax=Glycine soja TaxID=3848 RepID=UPI001039E15F|nr:CHD3-type chromatin-remodeling factor PICKLE-like [Glycine soja]
MSSSIGLRARSNHRPLYTINESDDDADILPRKKGKPKENIDRSEIVSSLNNIDKILDCEKRSGVACESDATKLGSKQNFVKQYLVKWKGLSYLHCTWVPEEEFLKAFKNHPGLKTKINNFHRHIASANNPNEDFVAIRPEWTMVDRILACRESVCEREREIEKQIVVLVSFG